jgi:hypothetical protein
MVVITLLLASLIPLFSHEILGGKGSRYCPNGTSEILFDDTFTGLSCSNLNCSSTAQFCWGSTICQISFVSTCQIFEGLLCQTDTIISSTFQVCRLTYLETSAVNNVSIRMQNPEEILSPPLLESSGIIKQFNPGKYKGATLSKFPYIESCCLFILNYS